MAYEYSDPSRASDPYSLPDVEVFWAGQSELILEDGGDPLPTGYYYAFGCPGCLWDGDPCGPYATYADALRAAREDVAESDVGPFDETEG